MKWSSLQLSQMGSTWNVNNWSSGRKEKKIPLHGQLCFGEIRHTRRQLFSLVCLQLLTVFFRSQRLSVSAFTFIKSILDTSICSCCSALHEQCTLFTTSWLFCKTEAELRGGGGEVREERSEGGFLEKEGGEGKVALSSPLLSIHTTSSSHHSCTGTAWDRIPPHPPRSTHTHTHPIARKAPSNEIQCKLN